MIQEVGTATIEPSFLRILFENSGLVYDMGGLFACSIQGTLLPETQQLSLTTDRIKWKYSGLHTYNILVVETPLYTT